jgi:hypothetical protein
MQESKTMSIADIDETKVVAPQQRSPQVQQYLAMLTSVDRALGTKNELDVDQLLELAQSRIGPVSLSADSGLHLEGVRCLAASIQRDPYYDDVGRRMANYYVYSWIHKYDTRLATEPNEVCGAACPPCRHSSGPCNAKPVLVMPANTPTRP